LILEHILTIATILVALTTNLLNICVTLLTLLNINVSGFPPLVHPAVVLMEDAELMEIGVTIKSCLTVPTITIQHVSAQIVAKSLIVMLLAQMQDCLVLAFWFLTISLNIVMMEIFAHSTAAVRMQPLQVLAITLPTIKQPSKRLSVRNTVLAKLLLVWLTPAFTPQSTATSPIFALTMFVIQQQTTLAVR